MIELLSGPWSLLISLYLLCGIFIVRKNNWSLWLWLIVVPMAPVLWVYGFICGVISGLRK